MGGSAEPPGAEGQDLLGGGGRMLSWAPPSCRGPGFVHAHLPALSRSACWDRDGRAAAPPATPPAPRGPAVCLPEPSDPGRGRWRWALPRCVSALSGRTLRVGSSGTGWMSPCLDYWGGRGGHMAWGLKPPGPRRASWGGVPDLQEVGHLSSNPCKPGLVPETRRGPRVAPTYRCLQLVKDPSWYTPAKFFQRWELLPMRFLLHCCHWLFPAGPAVFTRLVCVLL